MRTRFANAAQHADAFFVIRAISSKRPCIVLYVAGGFRTKLSIFFVFKLERLSSDFVFAFSKLRHINYFHTCEVFFSQRQKVKIQIGAFRDNNHSVSGSNTYDFAF